MKIFSFPHPSDHVVVVVDANELICDGGKPLPYSTYIGTINRVCRNIAVWTPAASTPRGYKPAARRLLAKVANEFDPGAEYPTLATR
jgi:hypothetical protein